jgi:mannose-6-phosphate isomerase
MPQADVDAMLGPLADRLRPVYAAGALDRGSPDFWAARAASLDPGPHGGLDRGIFSIYLLNLVELQPGDATFFGAGLLHAYLEGRAVEIMANSDNVIRGGLTPKHVDVPELLRVLSFEPSAPVPLGTATPDPRERRYDAPAEEFGLARLDLDTRAFAAGPVTGPEALIVVEGAVGLEWAAGVLHLPRGAAALVPAGVEYTLTARDRALAFRAYVP